MKKKLRALLLVMAVALGIVGIQQSPASADLPWPGWSWTDQFYEPGTTCWVNYTHTMWDGYGTANGRSDRDGQRGRYNGQTISMCNTLHRVWIDSANPNNLSQRWQGYGPWVDWGTRSSVQSPFGYIVQNVCTQVYWSNLNIYTSWECIAS